MAKRPELSGSVKKNEVCAIKYEFEINSNNALVISKIFHGTQFYKNDSSASLTPPALMGQLGCPEQAGRAGHSQFLHLSQLHEEWTQATQPSAGSFGSAQMPEMEAEARHTCDPSTWETKAGGLP